MKAFGSTALNIVAILSPHANPVVSTTWLLDLKESISSDYIKRSTSSIMDLSRQVIRFTIKITIRSITILAISKRSIKTNT